MKVVLAATNVAELLRRQAVRNGTATALIDRQQRVTWSELDARVDTLARGIPDLGAIAGYRAAIDMVNSIEFVTSYLAVLRAGLVAVPIDPGATTSEVAHMLADSGSRLCFADATTVATVRKAVRNPAARGRPNRAGSLSGALRPMLIVAGAPTSSDERGYGDVAAAGNEVVSPRDPEALAALLYSRGSNGRLGAAMLSHRALLTNIDQTSRTRPAPMSPADVVLGALPLSCVWGLGVVLGQVLLQGSTLVLGQRLEPTEMLQLIAAEQVTCVLVSAPMIASWARREDLAEKLASVRTLLSAAPLPAQVARAFEDRSGIPVERGYGLTEAAPLVASTVGVPDRNLGSSGRALPGVELQVVDEERRVVQADEPGEIEVRGRNMFSGTGQMATDPRRRRAGSQSGISVSWTPTEISSSLTASTRSSSRPASTSIPQRSRTSSHKSRASTSAPSSGHRIP